MGREEDPETTETDVTAYRDLGEASEDAPGFAVVEAKYRHASEVEEAASFDVRDFSGDDGPVAVPLDQLASQVLQPPSSSAFIEPARLVGHSMSDAALRREQKKKKYVAPRLYPEISAVLRAEHTGDVRGALGYTPRVPRQANEVDKQELQNMADSVQIAQKGENCVEASIVLDDAFFRGTELCIVVQDSAMTAKLRAPDSGVYALLLRKESELRSRLEQRGFAVAAIEIEAV